MYYCKNCGSEYLNDESIICVKCGTKKGDGNVFCHKCRATLQKKQDVCLYCGAPAHISSKPKYKITAGLFALIFGCLGIHNFYLGYVIKGTIQLCLFLIGLCTLCIGIGFVILFITFLWGFIERILILSGGIYKDKKGVLLQ